MWNGTSHSKAILLLKNLPSILYSRGLQNLQKNSCSPGPPALSPKENEQEQYFEAPATDPFQIWEIKLLQKNTAKYSKIPR